MTAFYPYRNLETTLSKYESNLILPFILPILTKTFNIKKTGNTDTRLVMTHNTSGLQVILNIIAIDKVMLLSSVGNLTISSSSKLDNIYAFITKLNPPIV